MQLLKSNYKQAKKKKASEVLVLRALTLSGKKDEETSANETQRVDNKIGGKSRRA